MELPFRPKIYIFTRLNFGYEMSITTSQEAFKHKNNETNGAISWLISASSPGLVLYATPQIRVPILEL